MASEIRNVMNTLGIVADLAAIDNSYAVSIVYDDSGRTDGNVFVWQASGTVNNGTVYAGATGVWEMQYNNPVNVMWFGAVGSGSVDDASAINAAIAYASDPTIKDEIYFPPGTYSIGSTLNIQSNTFINGHARMSVNIVPYGSYSGGALTISGSMASNVVVRNITLSGFQDDNDISQVSYVTFDTVGVTNTASVPVKVRGIYIRSCQFVTIKNCYIYNTGGMGIAVEGGSAATSSDILISGNFIQSTGDNGIAVRAINGSVIRSIVSNNAIYNAGKAGIKNTIEATSDPRVTFKDAVIANNTISGWGANVAEAAITASSYLSGNNVENCSITGNVIRANPVLDNQKNYINALAQYGGSITGNTCSGRCTSTGINVSNATDVTVTGNVVSGAVNTDTSANTAGIALKISANITVTGNLVKNSGGAIQAPGITVYETKSSTIADNVCYDDQVSEALSAVETADRTIFSGASPTDTTVLWDSYSTPNLPVGWNFSYSLGIFTFTNASPVSTTITWWLGGLATHCKFSISIKQNSAILKSLTVDAISSSNMVYNWKDDLAVTLASGDTIQVFYDYISGADGSTSVTLYKDASYLQVVNASPTQSYGIDENNTGGFPGWSADNFFANNIAYGNIGGDPVHDQNVISDRSKYIDFTYSAFSANTATNAGSTYSQAQVQSIITELRDLKTKFIAAGIMAAS